MNGQILQHSGEGDAAILSSAKFDTGPIERGLARRGHREAAALKAKQDQDKAFAEELKWNPGKAWYFHTDELNGKVKNVFDLQTQIHQGDSSPETARKLRDAKWDAETMAKQSQNIQQLYPQLQNQIDQGLDKYEDKALVKTKLNDEVLRKGSVNDFDFEKASDIKGFTGSDTFKDREWAVDFAKSIPELVQSHITNLGNGAINDKEIKSKFYELDENGNPKRAANGTAILKDSPEVLTAMKQEPRVVRKATDLVEAGKYKTVDEALRDEYIRPYASSQVKESQTRQFTPKSSSGKKNDVVLRVVTDVNKNRNVKNEANGSFETREGWVPKQADLNLEKFKAVLMNPLEAVDSDDAQNSVKHPGNQSYQLTKILLLPTDAKDGHQIHDKKELIKKHKNGVVYKPFVEGTRTLKDDTGHGKLVTEIFPYDQAASYLEEGGVDLKALGFDDPLGLTLKNSQSTSSGPLKKFK